MKTNHLLLSLGLTGAFSMGHAQEKPNVLFFLVDDLGWNDISANGSALYETPHIDEVLGESVYFSNAYAAYPRCVPSRYAMITGRHPARDSQTDGINLGLEQTTLAEALKAQGYQTFFAGKWHLGKSEEYWPHHQGFDVNKGGCDAGSPGSYFFPYGDTKFADTSLYGLEEGKVGEYITDRLTDETIRYIKEHKDGPFLAYLAHYAVHTPLQAKPERVAYYEEKVKGLHFEGEPYVFGPDGRAKMWQDNAVYAAMVESMDESFGKIVATLRELGIYDNTIIIFTSDHGGLSNSGLTNKRELATTNKPLRAGKGHIYEGGIKVPMFVRWPGIADHHAVTDVVIDGMDYYPSILEMCGLPLLPEQHTDGVSFVPALKGETINEDRNFYWHQTAARPESTGDYPSSVIRKGNYKLHNFLEDNRLELYNLADDPYEQHNLAEEEPERAKSMLQELNQWKKEAHVSRLKKKVPPQEESPAAKPERDEKKAGQGKTGSKGIKNPGFEDGADKGWKLIVRHDAKASLGSDRDAHEGKLAARVKISRIEEMNEVILESRPVAMSNEMYTLRFWAKGEKEGAGLKVQVAMEDAGGDQKYSAKTVELGTAWQPYELPIKPKQGHVPVAMKIRFQFAESGTAYWIDDLSLSEGK